MVQKTKLIETLEVVLTALQFFNHLYVDINYSPWENWKCPIITQILVCFLWRDWTRRFLLSLHIIWLFGMYVQVSYTIHTIQKICSLKVGNWGKSATIGYRSSFWLEASAKLRQRGVWAALKTSEYFPGVLSRAYSVQNLEVEMGALKGGMIERTTMGDGVSYWIPTCVNFPISAWMPLIHVYN